MSTGGHVFLLGCFDKESVPGCPRMEYDKAMKRLELEGVWHKVVESQLPQDNDNEDFLVIIFAFKVLR